MARPLRIEYPGAYYHAMNRGNGRQSIFLIDNDYGMFIALLEESSRLFKVKILSYCLMSNHYHLLIHTPKGNLSRFMRHLGGVYTQRFNKIHKKDGHLFKGRFKAILVQEDSYLTHLVRYIHLNPVQADLVQDPKDYPWSSHKDYLLAKDKEWLGVTEILKCFSPKLSKARHLYLDFIHDGLDPKTLTFFKKTNQGTVFGDQDFIDKIKTTYLEPDRKSSLEIPEKRALDGELSIKKIKKTVSSHFKISESYLYSSRRGEHNRPRFIALSIAREISGLKLAQIAKHFEIKSYKTVSSGCQRLKSYLAKDGAGQKVYQGLRAKCIQGET